MAKKSSIGIGTLMRKKLSDITNNSDSQHNLLPLPLPAIDADIPSIQQLLTERTQLIQLIAEKDELIESSGAELRRMQADIKKLQLQNRNLAQSNSLMLAEVNLGRDKRKILQHEISCRSALIKANALKAAIGSEKVKDNNRRRSRRHSAFVETHEHEASENLFEIEDTIMLHPCSAGERSKLRNEAPRSSFGRPLRRAAEKVQSYKEVPLNAKMRRLE
ncbi:shugoshin-1-like isoform X2 [Arachis stenosperma]|uniref:shugoshin-1-like isoform X2 n=1 Tax=Arachis stenosperma TaxID=217475 RepID=UPI0025ACAD25|nr:shugoshin-1-like isoform X2 [Arachis stenosperma]